MAWQKTMVVFTRIRSITLTALAVGFARFFSLLLFAVAARALTQSDNAGLIYVVTMSNLIVQLGTLGWLNLSRRMAARMNAENPDVSKGYLLRSFQIPAAVILGIVIVLIAVSYSELIGSDLSQSIFWSAIASIPLLFLYICREYLSGFNRPACSILTSETLPIGVACALIVLTKSNTFIEAVICVLVASIFSLMVQIPLLKENFKRIVRNQGTTFMTREWSKIAGYTVVGYGGKLLMDRMDTLILAPMAGLEQLALYNSATRIANLLLLAPIILLPVFSPRISRAFMAQDIKQLRFEMFIQLTIIALTVIPLAALLTLFPDHIISAVFGEEYRPAGSILWLIVIAQVMFAFSLPWSNLLMMTDGEVPYAIASAFALLTNLCAAPFLISKYEVTGAAIATVLSTFVLTAMFIIFGKKYLKGEKLGACA